MSQEPIHLEPIPARQVRRVLQQAESMIARPNTTARLWIRYDEHGNWESRAKTLLKLGEIQREEQGATHKELEKQVATLIALEAVEACLREAKKNKARQ